MTKRDVIMRSLNSAARRQLAHRACNLPRECGDEPVALKDEREGVKVGLLNQGWQVRQLPNDDASGGRKENCN